MNQEQDYSSDLTTVQWNLIKDHLEQKIGKGRPRLVETRNVINGILYILRTGCQWRYLPSCYPPKNNLYYYFSKWREDQTLDHVMKELREAVRDKAGRTAEPTAAIIDSQRLSKKYF